MSRMLSVAVIGASAVLCARAEAEVVRFTFTGTVTEVLGQGTPPPEAEIGAPFTVSFVFDTETPDTDPAPNHGFYDGAVHTAAADLNGLVVNATGGYVSALNNGFVGDTVFYESVTEAFRIQISLTDRQREALESDALPGDLDFSQWDLNNFFLGDLTQEDSWTIVGQVTGFAREVVGTPCPADWNHDTQVNSGDISAFLTSWLDSVQNGNLNADFNGDQAVNSSDVSAYLTAWLTAVQQGC